MLESHRSAILSAPDLLGKLQRARSLAYNNLRDGNRSNFREHRRLPASRGVFITKLALIVIDDITPAHRIVWRSLARRFQHRPPRLSYGRPSQLKRTRGQV